MSETLPLAAVKARFSELVDRVARQQDRVIVTRNGQPAVVLVSTDDLERLEETLAVMSDRSLTARSARAGGLRHEARRAPASTSFVPSSSYEVLEDERIVRVLAIGHRRDASRPR
jgi:antitoxin YefM